MARCPKNQVVTKVQHALYGNKKEACKADRSYRCGGVSCLRSSMLAAARALQCSRRPGLTQYSAATPRTVIYAPAAAWWPRRASASGPAAWTPSTRSSAATPAPAPKRPCTFSTGEVMLLSLVFCAAAADPARAWAGHLSCSEHPSLPAHICKDRSNRLPLAAACPSAGVGRRGRRSRGPPARPARSAPRRAAAAVPATTLSCGARQGSGGPLTARWQTGAMRAMLAMSTASPPTAAYST